MFRNGPLNAFDPYGAFKGWQAHFSLGIPKTQADVRSNPCARLSQEELDGFIETTAREHGIDPAVISAMIGLESAYSPCSVSPKGAQGLMQLMPATARAFGVLDPLDPRQNITGGVKLLKNLLARYHGDLPKALAAYNAGPARVDRVNGIPQFRETRSYIDRILARTEVITQLDE